jgi:hypothetical protein
LAIKLRAVYEEVGLAAEAGVSVTPCEESSSLLVPAKATFVRSDRRVLDHHGYQRVANHRAFILACVGVICVSGVLVMLPYWMPDGWKDFMFLLGVWMFIIPQCLLGATFHRATVLAVARTFDFWFLTLQAGLMCCMIGMKYHAGGVSVPSIVGTVPFVWVALSIGALTDASPFPVKVRIFFNLLLGNLWLFWGVAIRFSRFFYPDAVTVAFETTYQLYVLETTPKSVYVQMALVIAIFYFRFVVNGLLGNKYVILNFSVREQDALAEQLAGDVAADAASDAAEEGGVQTVHVTPQRWTGVGAEDQSWSGVGQWNNGDASAVTN